MPGELAPVRMQGRGLQRGDIAICDFDAIFVETGEAIPGARQAHMRLNTNTSDKAYIPGASPHAAAAPAFCHRRDAWSSQRLRSSRSRGIGSLSDYPRQEPTHHRCCEGDARSEARGCSKLGTRTSATWQFCPRMVRGCDAGLAAGMEGMVVGDRREVAVTFPDTWVPESLAGLDAKCDVTVNELFEFELVEVCHDHSTQSSEFRSSTTLTQSPFIRVAPCVKRISEIHCFQSDLVSTNTALLLCDTFREAFLSCLV